MGDPTSSRSIILQFAHRDSSSSFLNVPWVKKAAHIIIACALEYILPGWAFRSKLSGCAPSKSLKHKWTSSLSKPIRRRQNNFRRFLNHSGMFYRFQGDFDVLNTNVETIICIEQHIDIFDLFLAHQTCWCNDAFTSRQRISTITRIQISCQVYSSMGLRDISLSLSFAF